MTSPTDPGFLVAFTSDVVSRPVSASLRDARAELLAAVADLRTIPDETLTREWAWTGGGEDELRYGFYRIGEAFELAGIDAAAALRTARVDRGRAADLIAPATAARWDLRGLLLPLADPTWDADPGGGEWTIRQTMGHVVGGQRSYGVGTAWWQAQGLSADSPDLPRAPESIFDALPSDEVEAEGSPAEVLERLDGVLDASMERLAGLPADRLAFGARWSGFPLTVGFRLTRWGSHLREHTIQVEKTLDMLGYRPTEVYRLARLVLAAWGRAEETVFGVPAADAGKAIGALTGAVAEARAVAREVAALARG